MYGTDIELQCVFFLAYGILFGGISSSLFMTILFVIVYEFYVFNITLYFPPEVRAVDRVLVNIVFFFGWVLGRLLMLNETGFEEPINYFSEIENCE